VFLAEHKQLGRKVALKVLRKELSHNPEVVRRFVHEAQLVNQIKNEHIVEIHDFGEGPDGLQYFVMEFLVGRDLAQAREIDGPFGLNFSLEVVRQVGSALVAVHERKIIHRDLKPENIYLAEKGGRKDFVKLLDFGLAKLTEGTGSAADGTAIGTLLGTPLYMSPEQAMGLRVDWRTDIFSLGLVLLWMLSDQIPHESGSAEDIRRRRAAEPLPPLPTRTSRGEPFPPAVSSVLAGCLERDPGRRIQSVAEILKRLPVPPPPRTASTTGGSRLGAPAPGLPRPATSRPGATSGPQLQVLQLGNPAVVPAKPAALRRSALLAAGLGAGVTLVGFLLWLVLRPAPPESELPTPQPPEVQGEALAPPSLHDVPTAAPVVPAPAVVPPPSPVVAAPVGAAPPAAEVPVANPPSKASAANAADSPIHKKSRPAHHSNNTKPVVNDPDSVNNLLDPFSR
jgi:serine/threonine-protein kinase